MNKGIKKRVIVSFIVVCVFLGGLFLGLYTFAKGDPPNPKNYLDIESELVNAGYTFITPHLYEKQHHDLSEKIVFDYNANKALRNDFAIDIKDSYICTDKCYMNPEKMEEIILQRPYTFADFGTRFAPLVAHAGGGYRTKETSSTYTNAYEAIQQNYELGHRFFELDFQFTLDKKLAALHNWEAPDSVLSEQDWLRLKVTPEALENMTLTKILDLMLVHRDMFLITDSKAFEISDAEQEEQFNLIYDEVVSRDGELLNRVIPQVYSREMLESHLVLQNFPNIIFTGYASAASTPEIFQMFDDYPNLKMFTTDVIGRFIDDRSLIEGLKARNKKVSIHTVNEYKVFTDKRYEGVDGYYTDFLTPQDWQTWRQSPASKLS